MKALLLVISVLFVLIAFAVSAFSYPPGVGIIGEATSCMSCHVNNGPWTDEENTIIDILDKETLSSFRRTDGGFQIEMKRGEQRTILTVIGRTKDDGAPSPYRNAWLYIDPLMIGDESLSIFPPGWTVNLQLGCRLVGDELPDFEDAKISVLPMTIHPSEDAKDAELQLQVMLTKDESVKDDPTKGKLGNYFERTVQLRVID